MGKAGICRRWFWPFHDWGMWQQLNSYYMIRECARCGIRQFTEWGFKV